MLDVDRCDVAIVGAGPFGLSIAAHLRARGLNFRIFGKAMENWASRMPKGMMLKSDGFATNLYDPGGRYSYAKYCVDHGIPYADLGLPPTAESFVEYGRAFQKALVPNLEERVVTSIEKREAGYLLKFADGADCWSRFVVIATGLGYFGYVPTALSGVSRELVSHSSDHHDLSIFQGRKVAVIGSGASAADTAGLLHRAGADTHLISRRKMSFGERMRLPRTLYDRIRWPTTVIGPNWRSLLLVKLPLVFHRLPLDKRLKLTRTHLSASPGYFTKDMVLGKVTMHSDLTPSKAQPRDNAVELKLVDSNGIEQDFLADHVVCCTGYRPDLARLPFLSKDLLEKIATVEGMPVLSSWFESSSPGLYFVGAVSAPSFGPVVRFACGAEFTSSRLARRLVRSIKPYMRKTRKSSSLALREQ